ncbi:henylalanyl-tRNA synthetase beta chain (phenylalanine--tRNA ligase beta chain) [Nadsonia fulvescens var. elongata DSM 6958]|uniref:Phenylalanine--tRNA ligase beta subunit n=1 Tax=Nadsonia fulvescens var. elongata DSM 6958 TaxID=857566 RepID=A0A1E3PDS1_9ASCO|nr:henylalanyl-tRNA synthetase beta chain (phenylalanine--tRNA ligase beta chain) [Nadsonia fulvescens var. elongata DSM 6958]
MPTISVDKEDLYQSLGHDYTTEEFDELCFEFGIELDEDTQPTPAAGEAPVQLPAGERAQLKIEIPANRYDMLCFEGIARALNVFLGRIEVPAYTLSKPENMEKLYISPECSKVRPYAAAAIIRNVTFTQRRYESFIALQDKLHTNLCRNRTLVAIGTHDLDTIKGPFYYTALEPESFQFKPLNQTVNLTGKGIMEFYEKDKNLGKYLDIIREKPVYPLFTDSSDTVISMPPIINSDHSKITLNTKNIFFDVTATDKTKLEIVVNQIVAMFSEYSETPFVVEPVEVISDHNNESRISPNISSRHTTAEISYINSCIGQALSAQEICDLLKKMSLIAKPSTTDSNILDVEVPCTRSDILHQCDIMEDAAVGFGFNNLAKTFPASSYTIAESLPINHISDIIRNEIAMCGWLEVMPLTLSSHDENFAFLNRKDDNTTVVKLANPKTSEYQVVRTTLLPGILKTIKENRKHSLPISVFEVGDVVFKNEALERKAFNERHMAAITVGKTSGFEAIHGLLNRIMMMLRVNFSPVSTLERAYWIEEIKYAEGEKGTYFPGRGARIFFRYAPGKEVIQIGEFGVLHPEVLSKFEIPYAGASLELNVEPFL